MGGIDFTNQAVSPKHPQEPGDSGGAAALFREVQSLGVPKQGLEVPIPEAMNSELAATDELEELGVFRGPGAKSANTLVSPGRGLANGLSQLSKWDGGIDTGQGIEVAVVDGLGHLRSSEEVADALAHDLPGFGTFGVTLGRTPDPEMVGVVERGFDPQDRTLLVVKLDRVLAHAVFDADAFGAVLEIGDDFAFEGIRELVTQEAHDIGAGKRGHAVQDQRGIDLIQGGRVFEQKVGGPFGLIDGPVVVQGIAPEHLGLNRVQGVSHLVEDVRPRRAQLLEHQALGSWGV